MLSPASMRACPLMYAAPVCAEDGAARLERLKTPRPHDHRRGVTGVAVLEIARRHIQVAVEAGYEGLDIREATDHLIALAHHDVGGMTLDGQRPQDALHERRDRRRSKPLA